MTLLLGVVACHPSTPPDWSGSAWVLAEYKRINSTGDTTDSWGGEDSPALLVWESDSLSRRMYILNWNQEEAAEEKRAYQWLDGERLRWGTDTITARLEGEQLVLTESYGDAHAHFYYRRLTPQKQGPKKATVEAALVEQLHYLEEQVNGQWMQDSIVLHVLKSGWVVPQSLNVVAFEREHWAWWSRGGELYLTRQRGAANWAVYHVLKVGADGMDLEQWGTQDSLRLRCVSNQTEQVLQGHWILATEAAKQDYLSEHYTYPLPPPIPDLPPERRWSLEWTDDLWVFRQGEKLDTLPYLKSSTGVFWSVPYFFYKGTPSSRSFYWKITRLEEKWLSMELVSNSWTQRKHYLTHYYQLKTEGVDQ